MALALDILVLTSCLLYLVMLNPNFLAQSQQIPALFYFGDSHFDNGNNDNLLLTAAKANYRPYGIDYPLGPTGRFSNGGNIPDFLAQFLGFNKSIPPFATARGREILQGVNYASGAAGIRDESGRNFGDRISLNQQLQNHKITISRITSLLGDPSKVEEYLNKGLYVLYIGNEDYANNYILPLLYPTSRLFTPEQFALALIQQYTGQLKLLYNYGARKIVVFGLGLILGCLPQELTMFPRNGSPCVDFINDYADLFNIKLKPLVDDLNSSLTGAKFIYVNNTSIFSGVQSALGFAVVNASCCVVSPFGPCVPNKVPCTNRDEYLFWDNFHRTEVFNKAVATRAYNAELPSDAYPYDIQNLVQQ